MCYCVLVRYYRSINGTKPFLSPDVILNTENADSRKKKLTERPPFQNDFFDGIDMKLYLDGGILISLWLYYFDVGKTDDNNETIHYQNKC